jgi:tetratricopeptide (TPR) repeat protein/energy-coupling factor transporter ATP-binding protein EcfA2
MSNERFTNPFPGLRPFESTEDHLFFGRDGQSDELLRRLRRSRFLAVLGTSGSGKSSLVRAGMLPSLYGGLMTAAGSSWRVALFRPGHNPIGNLAKALSNPQVLGSGDDDDDDAALQRTIVEATLRRSALGLVEATRQARMPANENLLVVVDQFEEIFRFRRMSKGAGPEDESAAFIKLLLEAKKRIDVPVYIVITMRSDFLGDCAQFRDLPEAINDGQYLIPRMTRDQRREAITGPVAVGGGEIAGRLVNRLLNDVGDDPDHLPILQHALMRTWDLWIDDRRNGEPIDLRHYEAVGTMTEALSRHADEAYAELPNDRSRALADKLFKSLTEKGSDNREIRRPTRVSEIAAIAEATPAEIIAVIEPFRQNGRSFLMPPASVALDETCLIDISHESLIRGWTRLRKWVDEEARSANIYRRIADTALLHREGRAGLWRDPDLALALRWREENRPNATWARHYHPEFETAMAFIDASKTAKEAEIAERERARRRKARQTRIVATVFAVLFFIAAGFGGFALYASNRAYAARNEALVARNEALEEKKRADVARAEAVKEKNNAVDSEKRAVASEHTAREEEERAEAAAKLAEEQRIKAEAASAQARQAQALAEQRQREAREEAERALRAEMESARATYRAVSDKSNINTLAERLIQVASPEEAAYWRNYYATALAEIGRSDLSKNESTKVLSVFGDNINALTNRGYMSLIRFETQDALSDFERIRQIDPQYSLNYLNLGVTQANLKNYAAASNSIQKAIEWYRPGYFDGVFDSEVSEDITLATNRNVIYADGKSFNAALYYELANVEAFRGGDNFATLVRAADEHADRAKPSVDGYLTALNWAWMQLRKEPNDYGSLAIQAHLWRRAGYREWAKYYFVKFQCQHRETQDARYQSLARWVDAQLRASDDGARSDCGNIALPKTLSDPRLKPLKADRLASIGQYREAVALLDPEIERDPNNIELLLLRARYRQRAGYWAGYWKEEEDHKRFYAGARDDFAKLLKLVEQDTAYKPIVYLWWSFLGSDLGGMTDADRKFYYEKSIELGPANSGAMTGLSDMIAESEPEKAIELLRRSVALDPSASTFHRLGILQNKAGKHGDALKSINLAIALESDNATYYEERERAEAGLGVSVIERTRHLAEGYSQIGDWQLKQDKKAEAYQTYQKALRTLSAVANSDKSGSVANDRAVVNSKITRLLDANREKISGRILSIREGEGKTREVTIDRGADDGVVAGEAGTLWTIYSKVDGKERKVQKIGASKILSVERDSSAVQVTMDDPAGDKLVRVGDMVEVSMRVPPLGDRPNLWGLTKFHVALTSEDGKKVFVDYRMLYGDASAETVNRVLDEIAAEIKSTGERLSTIELMKTVIKKGRFKDKTLLQVMQNPTRADVQGMLNDMWQYPAMHYGQDVKVGRAFALWAVGEPD